jgi:solute carrier family 26 (sodium-independent sulfate anion transporter), member 11
VLSSWIRRALIAGGFGVGNVSSRHPTELVQVVPYGDVRSTAPTLPEKSDVEHGITEDDIRHRRPSSSYKAADRSGGDPIVPQNTPFFHFDIVSAVRAAEAGLHRSDYSRAESVASVSSGKRPDLTDANL